MSADLSRCVRLLSLLTFEEGYAEVPGGRPFWYYVFQYENVNVLKTLTLRVGGAPGVDARLFGQPGVFFFASALQNMGTHGKTHHRAVGRDTCACGVRHMCTWSFVVIRQVIWGVRAMHLHNIPVWCAVCVCVCARVTCWSPLGLS